MTGFHVDPDGLDQHANQVAAIAQDVGSGAAAEVAGTAEADFGILIGQTLGYGIRAVASRYERALRATSTAIGATADQLHSTASTYRSAEAAAKKGVTSGGATP